MNYAKSSPGFYLFKIKMSIYIFGTEKCKVTSGLKYVIYIITEKSPKQYK